MLSIRSSSVSRSAPVLRWFLIACALVALAAPVAGSALGVELGAARWMWRSLDAGGWGPWQQKPAASWPEARRFDPRNARDALGEPTPPHALAMEIRWIAETEGRALRRSTLWRAPEASSRAPAVFESPAPLGKRRIPGSLAGRLLLEDRIFDLQGYTGGTRPLPMRYVEIELRRSADDSLLSSGSTAADGSFVLDVDIDAMTDVRLDILSRATGLPGQLLQVLDDVGPGGDTSASNPQIVSMATVLGLAPGAAMDLGDLLLQDVSGSDPAQAFNLLDCVIDVVELLGAPEFLGTPPDSASVPPLSWDPTASHVATAFADGAVFVRSPGSGDTDGWSDGLVLAALGKWAIESFGRVDLLGNLSFIDSELDPRLAFGDGATLVFAAMVRARRSLTRVDALGAPVDDRISVIVDLGFPPPLGFPGSLQGGFDLETRAFAFGGTVLPLGQLGRLNVAAMMWDLVDDTATPDGLAGDDDPRDDSLVDGAARWFTELSVSLPALPLTEAICYEDLHEAWRAAYGEDAALDSIAVAVGASALRIDAFEPDDDAQLLSPIVPWKQPAPNPGGGVVIGELHLGLRDWVELSNRGDAAVDIGAWSVSVRRNGFGSGSSRSTTLPGDFVLAPGRSVILHEGGDATNNTLSDLYDVGWSIPWVDEDDGACILADELGAPVDFVRWDGAGGADPSSEPIPAGLAFTGSLASPPYGFSLARDSLATDLDAATDFAVRRPTPRVPNADFFARHTLLPRSDVDRLRLSVNAGQFYLVETGAPADDARPRIALEDGASPGSAGVLNGAERAARFGRVASADTTVTIALSQDPAGLTAAGLGLGAWVPFDATSLAAVEQLQARALLLDSGLDDVELSWINSGVYDSLLVRMDGVEQARLGGTAGSVVLQVGAGHHVLEIEPRVGGFAGALASASVFVGVTPCSFATDVDMAGLSALELVGMSVSGFAFVGSSSLADRNTGAASYPVDDVATASLRDPIDLTSQSALRFVHAAHLADDGDIAHAELSLDDGRSWIVLGSYRGSDHDGSNGDSANWLDGTLTTDDWVAETVPLAAYAGERALFRFRRVSNESGVSVGWNIDQIRFGTSTDGLVWVSSSGDDEFGCGARERPLATMSAAAGVASAGDTLSLEAGRYETPSSLDIAGSPEDVLLPLYPGLTVRGQGMDVTVVDGAFGSIPSYGGPETGLAIGDSTVLVQGLTIEGGELALQLVDTNARLEDVALRSAGTGLRVEGGAPRLWRCVVARNERGIDVVDGMVDLERCTITHNGEGVLLQADADSLRLQHSIVSHSFGALVQSQAIELGYDISCNDFYGASQFFLGLPDLVASNFNFTLDPGYCDVLGDDFRLVQSSYLLSFPVCGGWIGALGAGCAQAVSTPDERPSLRTRLLGNQPNPFNPRTRIHFSLERAGRTRLLLYDARGRVVRVLFDGSLDAGAHFADWDGRDASGARVSSGVYHAHLRGPGGADARPLVLLK